MGVVWVKVTSGEDIHKPGRNRVISYVLVAGLSWAIGHWVTQEAYQNRTSKCESPALQQDARSVREVYHDPFGGRITDAVSEEVPSEPVRRRVMVTTFSDDKDVPSKVSSVDEILNRNKDEFKEAYGKTKSLDAEIRVAARKYDVKPKMLYSLAMHDTGEGNDPDVISIASRLRRSLKETSVGVCAERHTYAQTIAAYFFSPKDVIENCEYGISDFKDMDFGRRTPYIQEKVFEVLARYRWITKNRNRSF